MPSLNQQLAKPSAICNEHGKLNISHFLNTLTWK